MPVLNEPAVTLEGVKIRAIHLTSIDFDVTIRIDNPNPFGATVRELPFTVFFRDGDQEKEIARGEAVTLNIPAGGTLTITVPVASHDLALVEGIASFFGRGSIQLRIEGKASIDHIIGWSLPFSKTIDITEDEIANVVLEKIAGNQANTS
jgi:LEA14-like dessication related protein